MLRSRIAIAIALALFVSGCGTSGTPGSGKVVTEERNVSGVNGVELEGAGEVTIEQSDKESLTITADDNLLTSLTSEVSRGRLTLGTTGDISPSKTVVYKITVKSLGNLNLSGSGSMTAKGVSTDLLDIVIAGSGEVTVDGKAEQTKLLLAGSGGYKGDRLQSKNVTVEIAGSGNASVAASEKLDVTIAGSGSVEYIGDPVVTTKTIGSGSVHKRN
jgi:putative autotransporter adhesin-like protein